MIPARKNRYIDEWFRGYTRKYLQRSFHRVLLTGKLPETPDGPVIVCTNHSSWWDMLMCFWLSRDVLGWDGYGPMDERQLRRYGVLTRVGVFGVDRETLQGSRDFLQYTRDLLTEQRRAIWITAQGAIVSSRLRPVRLYSGAAHLAQALGCCYVTTAAFEYEFWEEKMPEAFVSFGPMRRVEVTDGASRKRLLGELEEQIERQLDALAALRLERDLSAFRVLLSSKGSISPFYDALRGLRSRCSRQTHEQEHGAVPTPPRWGPAARREDR